MLSSALDLEREAIAEAIGVLTLVDVLARNSTASPHQTAISWRRGGTWHHLTWSEYRDRVVSVAAGLIALGVGVGDSVAIMAGNRSEHVIADLAVVHAGATPVSVYSTLAPGQVRHVAGHCGAVVAVLEGPSELAKWVDLELPDLASIVLLSGTSDDSRVVSWGAMIERGKAHVAEVAGRAGAVTPESVATLIYTSGTTGEPKGVVITQRNVVWTLAVMEQALSLPDHPRLVSYLPLAHVAERMATHYLGLWLAGEVTYCATVAAVMNVVKVVRPHLFVGVPRIWETIHQRLTSKLEAETDPRKKALADRALAAGVARVDGSASVVMRATGLALDRLVSEKIRLELGLDRASLAITTAGPIDPDLIRFFRALGIPLHELFGMTECCGPATVNLPGYDRLGSVGRALPGVEVSLAPDGELLIRGGNVADGYHKAPEASAATFDPAGWLRTGDLAKIDPDGFVWIVGRKKDLIVTASGKNIAPVPIELQLLRHPLVAHACVVGDQRPFLVALLALDPETTAAWATERGIEPAGAVDHPDMRAALGDLVDRVNESVSAVERIKKFHVIAEEWSPETGEVTPSLKLRRMAVVERYAADLDALYPDR